MEPDRQQNDRPVACVIAQQYSPPPSFHCSLILETYISAGRLKIVLWTFFNFLKIVSLEIEYGGRVFYALHNQHVAYRILTKLGTEFV